RLIGDIDDVEVAIRERDRLILLAGRAGHIDRAEGGVVLPTGVGEVGAKRIAVVEVPPAERRPETAAAAGATGTAAAAHAAAAAAGPADAGHAAVRRGTTAGA